MLSFNCFHSYCPQFQFAMDEVRLDSHDFVIFAIQMPQTVVVDDAMNPMQLKSGELVKEWRRFGQFCNDEFLVILGEDLWFWSENFVNENSVMFRRSLSFYTMPLIMINNPLIQIGIVKLICNFPQFGQKCPFLITVQIAAQIWFQHVQNTTCNV